MECGHFILQYFQFSYNRVFLTYADDANFIRDEIRTIERIEDVLLNACKDIGLAVNTEKTNYMKIGRHGSMIAKEQ